MARSRCWVRACCFMQLGEDKIQQKRFVVCACVCLQCVLFIGYCGELSKLEQSDF